MCFWQNQYSLKKKEQYANFMKAFLEYKKLNHTESIPTRNLFKSVLRHTYFLPAQEVVKALSTPLNLE